MFIKLQYPVTLTTEHLKLRPFEQRDWAEIHKYAVDPQISRYQGWGPNTVRDTKDFVKKCIAENADLNNLVYYFSITRLKEDIHIGGCMIKAEDRGSECASIGYTMTQSEWSKGLATEAARALINFGFGQLGLIRIIAECDADNIGSWRVMEKANMRLERITDNAKFLKGEWRRWCLYSITIDDWKNRAIVV